MGTVVSLSAASPNAVREAVEGQDSDGSRSRAARHAAELAQMALEGGESEWAEELLRDSRRSNKKERRNEVGRKVIALAPWIGGAAALVLTLTRTNEPISNYEHHLRVAFMLAAPWLGRAAALSYFGA